MMFLQQAVTVVHPLQATAAQWMWLLPLLPLLGFLINGALSVFGAARIGPANPGDEHGTHEDERGTHSDDHHAVKRHRFAFIVSIVGPGVLVASFVLAVLIFMAMLGTEVQAPYIQNYFSWMPVGSMNIDAAFQLDQLSMLMVLVITGVGSLIHIFSVGYMQDDPGYPRYFAYLNLFVFFMLVLVLGANYPVLFVGWEGVGLCSYLLIGFWFSDKANADAGKKAFIVNRIGDFGFLVAMFMLYANFESLDFLGVAAATATLPIGAAVITTICLFMFLGCAGKSAQIPLYVWLPDAMAGPTPVSALIHAATMVTAGVYLIARSSFLFALSPVASLTVAVIGALTALFAATIGLKQWDIKKVLAYSTVSQLGYMFVAVGSGAYVAGVFHLVTHAFFKALLFLGAGSVIYAMHAAYHRTGKHDDAQDMRNMGGLRKFMPITWVLMWVATIAIAGVPPFAGFFSKDEILAGVFGRAQSSTLADAFWLGIPGNILLYTIYFIGLATALLTAIYMTRMMLYTFHGPNRTGDTERSHLSEAPWVMTGPLVLLAIASAAGGWLNLPEFFTHLLPVGASGVLHHWLEPVVGQSAGRIAGTAGHPSGSTEAMLVGAAVAIAVLGIAFAWWKLKPSALTNKAAAKPEEGIERVLLNKYYVDEAYDAGIIEPTVALSRTVLWKGVDANLIDGMLVNGLASLARGFGWIGSRFQTGSTGTYAWALVAGVLVIIGAFTLR